MRLRRPRAGEDDSFLDLVADAAASDAASERVREEQAANARSLALEQAAHAMDVMEPIIGETVAALKRLRVGTSAYPLDRLLAPTGRVAGEQTFGGWRDTRHKSIERARAVDKYRRSLGVRSRYRGWRLPGPIACGVTHRGSLGRDGPQQDIPSTLESMFLDQTLRSWGFSHFSGDGLCLVVSGEPRCYVDVQLANHQSLLALNPFRFEPEAFRAASR